MNELKAKTERLDLFGPTDPAEYDAWLRAKVQEALDDPRPAISAEEVRPRSAARRIKLLEKLKCFPAAKGDS